MPITSAIESITIIGAGPAGVAAAAQCAKHGIYPILVDRTGKPGGLIENARLIDNYPGLNHPLSGTEFSRLLKTHLDHFNIHITKTTVQKIEYQNHLFKIMFEDGEFLSKTVIYAAGTSPKPLDLKREQELSQSSIFYEVRPLMDHEHFRSLVKRDAVEVVVVGGGEAANDYALSLAQEPSVKISLIMRGKREQISANKQLSDLVTKHPRINIITESEITNVHTSSNDSLSLSLLAKNGKLKESKTCHFLLVAIGRHPNLSAISSFNIFPKGLVLAGDVKRGSLGQLGMAVGDGLAAAEECLTMLKQSIKEPI